MSINITICISTCHIFIMFFSPVGRLWALRQHYIISRINQKIKNQNFKALRCVDHSFQLASLPSQRLFLAATWVKLNCRSTSLIDFVFSLRPVRVSCGTTIHAAHYTDPKFWVYEHTCANLICLHSNVASLVFRTGCDATYCVVFSRESQHAVCTSTADAMVTEVNH